MLGGAFKSVDHGKKSVFEFYAAVEIGRSRYCDVKPDEIRIFIVISVIRNQDLSCEKMPLRLGYLLWSGVLLHLLMPILLERPGR